MISTPLPHRRPRCRRRVRPLARLIAGALSVITAVGTVGCVHDDVLRDPTRLQLSGDSTAVYGVAPILNESGTTVVDPLKISDAIQRELQMVDGVDAVPVNRVIEAMRELRIARIATPNEAQEVARVLGVDGLIVGTINDWNPYRPMRLGLALELHRRTSPMVGGQGALDLAVRVGADPAGTSGGPSEVVSAAAVFDATDHRTLKSLRHYADARHAPDQAYGPDLYLVSMDRFTQFAAHRLLETMISAVNEPQTVQLAGQGSGR